MQSTGNDLLKYDTVLEVNILLLLLDGGLFFNYLVCWIQVFLISEKVKALLQKKSKQRVIIPSDLNKTWKRANGPLPCFVYPVEI